MAKLLLIGSGGHCASVFDSVKRSGQFEEIGVVAKDNICSSYKGLKVIGTDSDLPRLRREGWEYAFVAIGSVGDTTARERAVRVLEQEGFAIATICDPSSLVSANCLIGKGAFIGKHAIVNFDSVIGEYAIVNTNAVIEHGCHIGRFVHVSPSATLCGDVFVGDFAHIGAGSTIIQGINIGKKSLIGAGAVVIRNVSDGEKVVGNPAREI